MKKNKEQSPVKAARKTIHERLLTELKNITSQLKKDGITIVADIEKEAKKLAKKITKGSKVDEPVKPEPVKETTADKVKAPAKESAPAKKKTAAKAKDATETVAPVVVAEAPAVKVKAVKPATPKKEVKK